MTITTSTPGITNNARASNATIPAVVTTVILIIIVIGIIASVLIVLYFVRRKSKKENNVYTLPVIENKQDRLQTLANPLYSGKGICDHVSNHTCTWHNSIPLMWSY